MIETCLGSERGDDATIIVQEFDAVKRWGQSQDTSDTNGRR
jgi:hypothetical protein